MIQTLNFPVNPNYLKMSKHWEFSAACYDGAIAVKDGDSPEYFLPRQPFETEEYEKKGRSPSYDFRLFYTTFENFYRPIIDDLTGIMQKNEPNIRFGIKSDDESPEDVRKINWYGNSNDDALGGIKTRLNFNQILFGRYGLLLEVLTDADGLNPEFNVAEYSAENILDGETFRERPDSKRKLKWVILNETASKFDKSKKIRLDYPQYRVLGLDADGTYYQRVFEGFDAAREWNEFDLDNPTNAIYPTFKGNTLDFIPFTVCNYNRLGFDAWQTPPFLDVARIAIDAYNVDSWLKTALFHCATPTLAVFDADKESKDVRLGGVLYFQSSTASEKSANAKMIETSGAGIGEMRACKAAIIDSLRYSSIRDLLNGAGANSSAEALKLRVSPGTSIIAAVDKTGALAIEEQLCFAYVWADASNPRAREDAAQKIAFDADCEYFPNEIQLQSVVQLLEANQRTQTLSNANIYRLLEKTVPGTLSSFEDNKIQLAADPIFVPTTASQKESDGEQGRAKRRGRKTECRQITKKSTIAR